MVNDPLHRMDIGSVVVKVKGAGNELDKRETGRFGITFNRLGAVAYSVFVVISFFTWSGIWHYVRDPNHDLVKRMGYLLSVLVTRSIDLIRVF
jgi:hypothetical protein